MFRCILDAAYTNRVGDIPSGADYEKVTEVLIEH
jgi:hypothetical protein